MVCAWKHVIMMCIHITSIEEIELQHVYIYVIMLTMQWGNEIHKKFLPPEYYKIKHLIHDPALLYDPLV